MSTRITEYFIDHSRITLIALLTLVTFGVISLLTLKTSGFPSPEVKFVIINTAYPGAASGTVLQDVTKPIESSIKQIDGVKSYSSQSLDNFSNVTVNIDESANVDAVKAKIDSTVRSVALPDAAKEPEVATPNISNDEYSYAIVSKNGDVQTAYRAADIMRKKLEEDPDVIAVNVSGELKQEVVVRLDTEKLHAAGLTQDDVSQQLKSWDLAIPAAENANFGAKNYNIVMTLSGSSLEDLQNLVIASQSAPMGVKLSQIADVTPTFSLENQADDVVGFRSDGKTKVEKSVIFGIDVDDNANLGKYDPKLQATLTKYFDTTSSAHAELTPTERGIFDQVELVDVYNTNTDNQRQIHEVLAGLAGEKWGIPVIGWIGFAFGAIQLVFIFMMVLVSWRAAIIAAIAIPLSFFFSTITLLLTGNDLNTLTLFSLVLVIGLVVDPAIVVLEVIQRYIDKGEKGKQAVLAAIDDIGYGLFVAVLTSILVFIPFGVVSGIFGAIIAYIPLTIIPALIGSYIVPLVFLAWFGSKILKRRPGKSQDEEKNLWRSARWMIKTNRRLLDLGVLPRIGIIIVALVLPFIVAGAYMGSGQVKMVQFSQPEDGEFLQMVVAKFPQGSSATTEANSKQLIGEIMKNPAVQYVAPVFSQGNSSVYYFIRLSDPADRKGTTASEIADNFNHIFENSNVDDVFFDVNASTLSPGPPNAIFPISIGIKSQDLSVQAQVATDVTKILNQICHNDGAFSINSNCAGENKVVVKIDNGQGAQANKFIEVRLERSKLLTNPVNPIALREQLANIYQLNQGEELAKLQAGNEQLPIVIAQNNTKPASVEQLQAVPIQTLTGQSVPLGQIADVREVESPGSIRQVDGEAVGVVTAKVQPEFSDQQNAALVQQKVIDEFNANYKGKYPKELVVEGYSEGDVASIAKSFSELGIALVLAIVLTYLLLVLFFDSLTMPLVILFAIPLTFLGIFPGLAYLAGGQLGFLEIIGIIILVGLVENVAIFLIDAANRKEKEGWKPKDAIAYASGVRFRPIILTKVMAVASLAPLAILSEFYRSLSVVIIFGLLTSGILSLFVTPILYIAFQEFSHKVRHIGRRKKS